MGRSGVKEIQVGQEGRFGLEGSNFRTVSQSVSEVGIELLGQLKMLKIRSNT